MEIKKVGEKQIIRKNRIVKKEYGFLKKIYVRFLNVKNNLRAKFDAIRGILFSNSYTLVTVKKVDFDDEKKKKYSPTEEDKKLQIVCMKYNPIDQIGEVLISIGEEFIKTKKPKKEELSDDEEYKRFLSSILKGFGE